MKGALRLRLILLIVRCLWKVGLWKMALSPLPGDVAVGVGYPEAIFQALVLKVKTEPQKVLGEAAVGQQGEWEELVTERPLTEETTHTCRLQMLQLRHRGPQAPR